MINTILFDLDGTVLPLDMDKFSKIYFQELSSFFMETDTKHLISNIWKATEAMIQNTDNKTNEDVFMETFKTLIGDGEMENYINKFDEFYDTGFLKTKAATSKNSWMEKSIIELKLKNYKLVLATNPLFPAKAIHHRIRWAGFDPSDFIYITAYEHNHFCKPQIQYYEEILSDIGKSSKECLMVGNDVQEDLIASKIGISTFLIQDHLIHRRNEEIVSDFKGHYEDFFHFVEGLPKVIHEKTNNRIK